MDYMKNRINGLIVILFLFTVVSCGNDGDGHSTYVDPVATVNKAWTVTSINDRGIYKFTAIDFTNENAVLVSNLKVDGIDGVSDCTYDTAHVIRGDYYGTFNIESVTAGDPDICGELTSIGYGAHKWRDSGVEVLTVGPAVLH